MFFRVFTLFILGFSSVVASADSFEERAMACVWAHAPATVFRGVSVEQDLFEVRVTLVTCDEDYYWYEGVCGHTEERRVVVFSRVDGGVLSGCEPVSSVDR